MESRKVKNTDRISALPDALIHQIFSTIDTVDAVRTCVLSKRWRYFWTSLPYLFFDSQIHNNKLGFARISSDFDKVGFVNFINQVIVRRDSIPIIKFCYTSDYDVPASVVESLIYYAVKHQVQHLQIVQAGPIHDTIHFPSCFNGCESLTTLELDGCDYSIKFPTSFGLPYLKSLYLDCFEDFDGSIFSRCPNLQTLRLHHIALSKTPNFSIAAPNLKTLDIYHDTSMEWPFGDCEITIVAPKLMKFKYEGAIPFLCSAENLVSLDQVEIILPDPELLFEDFFNFDEENQKEALRLFGMLDHFHCAKSVTLSLGAIKFLSLIPSSLNERPSPFSNLKFLKVTGMSPNYVSIPTCIMNYFLKGDAVFQFKMAAS